MFINSPTGVLVPINGTDWRGTWSHVAFLPHPLPDDSPLLSPTTFNAVAKARASLAALDVRASLLPNPALLRRPTLRIEAHSTSALEGTYAPLEDVLAADEDSEQPNAAMREILNYVAIAEQAFAWVADGRPLTLGLLEDLQAILVSGTAADVAQAGRIRTGQVAIGTSRSVPIQQARFIPPPPGLELETLTRDWVGWINADHADRIDPVVAAAMSHYQFETLHPFNDGNGRIGRLTVVLQLMLAGALSEPTLSVSPWFEARRPEYYDRLLAVSTQGDWDGWVEFFALGLAESAAAAERQLRQLLEVAEGLKADIRAANLRAETAMSVIDFAIARPIFTVRQVERQLGIGYGRANGLVRQLVEAGVFRQYGSDTYNRRFTAPAVLEVLSRVETDQ